MKKRFLGAALALTLLLALLSGCAPGQPSSPPEDGEQLPEEFGPDVDLGPLLDEGIPLADTPALSVVLTPEAPGKATKKNSSAVVDYSNAADGYFMVKWTGGGSPKLKVLVRGPNAGKDKVYESYQYDLRTDGKYEAFPLSDGSGKYTIGVYKNTSGTKYSTVLSCSTNVTLTDEFAPFIRPNQYVTYDEENEAVAKAAELCAGAENNLEKVEKIYTYVVNNTTYDKQKADQVKKGQLTGYLPDVDETLRTGKGICFDYAALMSAMLRSQGVPIKLVIGYASTAYHAWINVWSETEGWIEAKIYFDGKEWKLMDPTFASSGKGRSEVTEFIGNGKNYSAKYYY